MRLYQPYKLLVVGDLPSVYQDALNQLKRWGYPAEGEMVAEVELAKEAAEGKAWDAVLVDGELAPYQLMEILFSLQDNDSRPGLVLVLNEAPREEFLLPFLKAGVADWVLKDEIWRFVPIFERELRRQIKDRMLQERNQVLDRIQEAVWVCDLQCQIQYWNQRSEQLFGWEKQEILRKRLGSWIIPSNQQLEGVLKELLNSENSWSGEMQMVTHSGRSLVVMSRWSVLRDSKGKAKALLAVNQDLSEKKELEQQFFQAQRMQGLGSLAVGVAHELNNSLAPVLMSVNLLRESLMGKVETNLLTTMERCLKRGTKIIGQVLTLAQGATGERISIQLEYLLNDLHKLASETFPPTVRVSLDCQDDTPMVFGEVSEIYQMFLNLLLVGKGGGADQEEKVRHIWVRLKSLTLKSCDVLLEGELPGGVYTLISFHDDGPSVPHSQWHHLFAPGFMAKQFNRGMGYELSSAQSIAKSHGGAIRYTGSSGGGNVFEVLLPALPTPREFEVNQSVSLSIHLEGHGDWVLVVDDELAITETMKRCLERQGFVVKTASNGEEALHVYLQFAAYFKHLVVDYIMPKQNGLEVIQELKRMNPSLNAVLLTGDLLQEDHPAKRPECEDLFQLIRKPCPIEDILHALRKPYRNMNEVETEPQSSSTCDISVPVRSRQKKEQTYF